MNKTITRTITVLSALLLTVPAYAQSAIVGVEDLDDRIDQIQEDVEEEFERSQDSARFGFDPFPQGWAGGVSLGFTGTSGNTDTADLSFGGRLRYGNGPWNHSIGFAAEYGRDDDKTSREEAFLTYDVNRLLNEQYYVFGLGSVRYDAFSSNEWDAFLGVGPGVRVINEPGRAWRLQAGPGVRYTRDQTGADQTEIAGIVASRFYTELTDTSFLTNDTDVLFSDSDTTATNELGVNFRVSDRASTRVSWRLRYESDPLPGLKEVDNTVGLALVYGF